MNPGAKREWAAPMDVNAQGSKPWGNWKGTGEIWNIVGRRPGRHYTIATERNIRSLLLRGYQRCDGSQERFVGWGEFNSRLGENTQGGMSLGGKYLLWLPIEQYRKYRREKAEARQAGMDLPTKTILERNPIEVQTLAGRQPGYVPRDGNVFFKDPDHGDNGYKIQEVNRGEG